MEFYQTVMGRKFYEGTMPALVRAVEALTERVDALVEELAASEDEQDAVVEEGEVVNLEDERAAAAFAMREAIRDAVWANYKSPHLLDIINGVPLPQHAPESLGAEQEGR